ncbi:hypothetical protein EDC56_1575 [Sinobacterium caligoides]|uniref:Uncharacterized protein n=1 Tax=Sinobacterium caligoides TaxID=933926 RepID=A0A3N2DMW4_9GAMM|nr:hypothetical protein [Sinobacterium caligoides]ROS01147.1 hypothetical protein EDC56_1575 [Sinobacterium caligoides]
MFDKIRLSLWDIFTFFLTGFLASALFCTLFLVFDVFTFAQLFDFIRQLPSSIVLVAAPLLFTLLGMLIEPIANYFDKKIGRHLFGWAISKNSQRNHDEERLEQEIKNHYLGSLNGEIINPFSLCKEYVETKQLSTTFMVFLSRYGFYRNCALLTLITGSCAAVLVTHPIYSVLIAVGSYFLAALFKRRSAEFYSYLAPTVYRAFLIDKLEWRYCPANDQTGQHDSDKTVVRQAASNSL